MNNNKINSLLLANPCSSGRTWLIDKTSDVEAWNQCVRGDWMWWALRNLNLTTKELSVKFSRGCAEHASHLRGYYAADAAAADAADADAATVAAAYAADAADAAAADAAAERKWQADFLRTLITPDFSS